MEIIDYFIKKKKHLIPQLHYKYGYFRYHELDLKYKS